MPDSSNLYTIPANQPFGRSLARGLLDRAECGGFSLQESVILLPTRRACRTMREMFLRLSEGRPLLLPRLQPLGDVDEEELALNLAGSEGLQGLMDIPPALPVLRRRILLARLILRRPDFRGGFDQALKLAEALGGFIDQIYIEELEFEALHSLVPEDFADHWQITLEFLKILGENWPAILAEQGAIDAADRRGRLMRALAELWEEKPPEIPVIAAGSTGSVPATARLMKVIAGLPRGEVILPGYDSGLDADSWTALEPSHPQFGFKQLFGRMGVERDSVQVWSDLKEQDGAGQRGLLAREVMRPAATSGAWMSLSGDVQAQQKIEKACRDLELVVCENRREEADVISLIFREALEHPEKIAALVTPDRGLARRVSAACQRWGIEVDDSAGQDLGQSNEGVFLRLVLEAALSDLEPSSFLALLKHPLCRPGIERRDYAAGILALEKYLLRGPKPRPGFAGLWARLGKADQIPEKSRRVIENILHGFEPILKPLIELCHAEEPQKFEDFLKSHLEVAQDLSGGEVLWSGETGEQAARFFSELLQEVWLMTPVRGGSYGEGLKVLMEGVSVRPSYGTHPRLMILGQLEARLMDADVVVLGGLNEGTWPAGSGHDPWMSRPMRGEFGLPSPERSIGLAAHDFVQALCCNDGSGRVVMTRSKRVDGAPSVPARWLQRLETVLSASGILPEILDNDTYRYIAKSIDKSKEISSLSRPEPRPPVGVRPERLSVTKIETWLQDPYQIYARHVLGLKPLDPVGQELDAAQLGSVLHDILDRFVVAHPDSVPEEAHQILYGLARDVIAESDTDEEEWNFWWPRFERIADWFVGQEKFWRGDAQPLKTEARGSLDLSSHLDQGVFTLHGIADRIDRMGDGSAALIDYKSGGQFSKVGMISGKNPQLPLEALILRGGGFEDMGAYNVSVLSYWVLSGAAEAGKVSALGLEETVEALEKAEAGLVALIKTYQDESVPYYAQPRADRIPRFNDYEHLVRVKEWGTNSSDEEAA